ncbi:low molecular weight phosphotyrosine protein phosphatase [Flavobacterium salilacus subsp. salilacus]|uniref:low molecular weight protein-tyrosine-phosphatase n=1 Tax=Flavobacterium TaxID=237 RepID=UPI0010751117|nr:MULTISPECIES: low molecular weight protein-tyrosine-phosphatase [Flavobacterium]KAF2519383.1 low molecular weight phosphotyrosine protein phosphatase [Flavobacterium salilacus subsp. salilacus]MBE1614725.1 low molecular weight phosphotyrosine protein phosphatase [Flavobacterium sp. SaA2.13]
MPVKILMVCLGNICRSPLAEGILQSKLPKEKFIVDSAGTGDWHAGQQPDKRSVATARNRGLDITQQRARQIKTSDFDKFDYIYVMDASNYNNVVKLAPNTTAKEKVRLMMDALYPGENIEVPDPYFGGDDGFYNVYDMLDEACTIVADNLLKTHS